MGMGMDSDKVEEIPGEGEDEDEDEDEDASGNVPGLAESPGCDDNLHQAAHEAEREADTGGKVGGGGVAKSDSESGPSHEQGLKQAQARAWRGACMPAVIVYAATKAAHEAACTVAREVAAAAAVRCIVLPTRGKSWHELADAAWRIGSRVMIIADEGCRHSGESTGGSSSDSDRRRQIQGAGVGLLAALAARNMKAEMKMKIKMKMKMKTTGSIRGSGSAATAPPFESLNSASGETIAVLDSAPMEGSESDDNDDDDDEHDGDDDGMNKGVGDSPHIRLSGSGRDSVSSESWLQFAPPPSAATDAAGGQFLMLDEVESAVRAQEAWLRNMLAPPTGKHLRLQEAKRAVNDDDGDDDGDGDDACKGDGDDGDDDEHDRNNSSDDDDDDDDDDHRSSNGSGSDGGSDGGDDTGNIGYSGNRSRSETRARIRSSKYPPDDDVLASDGYGESLPGTV